MKIISGKPHIANPCPHKYIRKAYYLGLPGEDYVCVACVKAAQNRNGLTFCAETSRTLAALD
jgi:hypothetical protein